MDLSEYERTVCSKHRLTVVEPLKLGMNSDAVLRVTDGVDTLVLKLAVTPRSVREVAMNLRGYDNLRSLGLSRFIPRIAASEAGNGFGMILMEDCGPNYLSQLRTSSDPLQLYLRMAAEIQKMYALSKVERISGKEMLDGIVDLIAEQYQHFQNQLDPAMEIAAQLSQLKARVDVGHSSAVCFSNWDFTPEDSYLTPQGLKYSDPHAEILGVPIVDLACYSGLIRLYDFPLAEEGVAIFESMAREYIPALLGIQPVVAERVFHLGRLLQCFLSTRFRLPTQPQQATEIFQQAQRHLREILE